MSLKLLVLPRVNCSDVNNKCETIGIDYDGDFVMSKVWLNVMSKVFRCSWRLGKRKQ